MNHVDIAVLLTCHNRKQSTLTCLDSLMTQDTPPVITFHIYLVDDGCTDGTPEAVEALYPHITLLTGNGNLFWCGGMRLAFAQALKNDFDYYLWLNDDVRLYSDALRNLLETSAYIQAEYHKEGIVVGSLSDQTGQTRTYGGSLMHRRFSGFSLVPVELSSTPQTCDVFNGNCVLIPHAIARAVGTLREGFKHAAGDLDYGLRASQQGFSSWVCPQYVGICARNPLLDQHQNNAVPFRNRRQFVLDPTTRIRIQDWMTFTRYHCKLVWPIYYFRSLIRLKLPWLWVLLRAQRNPRV